MEHAPGLVTVLTSWTVNVPVTLTAVGAWLLYLRGMRRAESAGLQHPVRQFALFSAGAVVVLLAVLSPIAVYSKDLLWADFTGFLMLTMVAPPLLLLGAPLTLAFRASGKTKRAKLRAFYRSRAVAIVTFPVATWLTFAAATYIWQFTSLTDVAARNSAVRDVQQLTLLLVGLLFWLPAISADPLRWRLAYPLRSLYIFVEMTHKGLFGGMFLSMNHAMHHEFASRAPAWAPDPILDQRISILILWIGGNLIFLLGLIGVVLRWVAYEQRNQRRTDYRLQLQRQLKARRAAALDQVFQKPV
jgi:putative copper resistance protein D